MNVDVKWLQLATLFWSLVSMGCNPETKVVSQVGDARATVADAKAAWRKLPGEPPPEKLPGLAAALLREAALLEEARSQRKDQQGDAELLRALHEEITTRAKTELDGVEIPNADVMEAYQKKPLMPHFPPRVRAGVARFVDHAVAQRFARSLANKPAGSLKAASFQSAFQSWVQKQHVPSQAAFYTVMDVTRDPQWPGPKELVEQAFSSPIGTVLPVARDGNTQDERSWVVLVDAVFAERNSFEEMAPGIRALLKQERLMKAVARLESEIVRRRVEVNLDAANIAIEALRKEKRGL